MALGDGYATVDEYRNAKNKLTGGDDLSIARDILAVSRYIDRECGRPLGFNRDPADGDPVHRYYMPKSSFGSLRPGWAEAENPWKASGASRYLDIDDHVSVTEIAIDEHRTGTYSLVLAAGDYELLPRNALTAPEPMPYRQIMTTEWGTQWAWPPGGRVRVSGYGGWPAIPPAVASACIELTAILRIESVRATNSINEVQQVVSMSRVGQNIVADLIATYKSPGAIL